LFRSRDSFQHQSPKTEGGAKQTESGVSKQQEMLSNYVNGEQLDHPQNS